MITKVQVEPIRTQLANLPLDFRLFERERRKTSQPPIQQWQERP